MSLALNDQLQAEALSVQQPLPPGNGTFRFGSMNYRTSPLPPPGTREREWQLRQYWHNPYNTIFKGAASGSIIPRLQSLPWEVVSKNADRWQRILMTDWENNIAKLAKDYLRHDAGAWVEIIAPGDPRFAPTGPMVGIKTMDSLRVYPTGNPVYPAIYYDIHGRMHLMHRSRVIHLVDSEDSEENLQGYGECALSRSIAPVRREILINKFIESYLDDKPMPGIITFSNLSRPEVETALRAMQSDQSVDDGGQWGRVLMLYSLEAEHEAKITWYANSKAPEGFDLEKYKQLIAKEIASTTGLDLQDFWELSGAGIGTGTQSEILAQKSRGKTFGRLLKSIERALNQALPEEAEFRFQYKDAQEDKEDAEKAQAWTIVTQTASTDLSTDERRQLLANQIPAFKDVLLDENGQLKRLPDDDPKTQEQQTAAVIPAAQVIADPAGALVEALSTPEPPAPSPAQMLVSALTQRAFSAVDFSKFFRSFVRVGQAQSFSPAIMRATFREELLNAGTRTYEQGLRDGGVDPTEADAVTLADRRRTLAQWLAEQNGYINSFVDDVNNGTVTPETAKSRADLWSSKSLRAIYYTGLHDAAGEKKFMWKLGATEKHCKTCLALNGQVHSLKEYMKAGLLPGAQTLECKGFKCDCGLTDAADLPKRGRLPGTASPIGALGAFISGLLSGKSLADEHRHEPDSWDRWLITHAEGTHAH